MALVAAATVAVFFGVGLYSLGRSHREIAGVNHAREVVSASGGKASSRADVPSAVAASLGTLVTMTASSTVPASRATPPGATGPQPGPTLQAGASAQNLGVSAEQGGEAVEARVDRHPEPKRFVMASAETVSGPVTQVSDAMTWVVGDKTVHLWGIRPGARSVLSSLEKMADWVRAKGPVECRKQAHSRRYRCSTSAGEDIAEAALLAGVAHAAGGATPAYRNAEAQARRRGSTP
jgi:endonuclease YncB( thermonuclease family)